VEEIVDNGRKVIVFSQYLGEGINKMEQSLTPYGTAKIVGDQSEPIRNSALESVFWNSEADRFWQ
jgi:hypothetical protein